jgi:hypothetical protein
MNTPREIGFQVAKQPSKERQCCPYFGEIVVYDCRIGHVNCMPYKCTSSMDSIGRP